MKRFDSSWKAIVQPCAWGQNPDRLTWLGILLLASVMLLWLASQASDWTMPIPMNDLSMTDLRNDP